MSNEIAIEAERQRVIELREANEKIAAKKAANKKHRTAVNRDALEGLEKLGFLEDDCKKIIIAIAKEQIRNITIK